MKTLNQYITEKLKLKNVKPSKYYPMTKKQLRQLLLKLIDERGNDGDFNDIDTSEIFSMYKLFYNMKDFNGNISQWNISNVTDMDSMFYGCTSFNQDISKWDVSSVENTYKMFYKCKNFNQDLSKWNIKSIKNYKNMFDLCPIKEKYKPKFN